MGWGWGGANLTNFLGVYCKTNEFSLKSIMLVAIILLSAFKIIVILTIDIHNTSVKENSANLLSNIFASPACVSPNSSFFESYLSCWSPRYTFVLNICKNHFFPQFIHLSHRVSLSFDMNYAKYRMLLNSVSNAHTVNFTARLTFWEKDKCNI